MKNKIDKWTDEIYNKGSNADARISYEYVDPFKPSLFPFQVLNTDKYIKFETNLLPCFYAYFQPCFNRTAPLAVHTPGYGGEMSMHPELSRHFHVLHINPLGYTTPEGKDAEKITMDGLPPVLLDTVLSDAKSGYFNWLLSCVCAVKWAWTLKEVIPNRVSFFGTSQGGGGSLLLGSLFSGRGTACVAADQPFLTDFKKAGYRGAYGEIAYLHYKNLDSKKTDNALSFIDTLNHVHRMDYPVLLTSGGQDIACPPDTIERLFKSLKGTKSYTHFSHIKHGYNREFLELVLAWLTMFA